MWPHPFHTANRLYWGVSFLAGYLCTLPATVNNHSHEIIHAIQVNCICRRVEQTELQRENHSIGELGVAMQLLHVLEPLQVQRQDHGKLLHTHPAGKACMLRDRVCVCAHSDINAVVIKLGAVLTASVPPAYCSKSHSSICIHCTKSLCYWSPWRGENATGGSVIQSPSH